MSLNDDIKSLTISISYMKSELSNSNRKSAKTIESNEKLIESNRQLMESNAQVIEVYNRFCDGFNELVQINSNLAFEMKRANDLKEKELKI